MTGCDGATPRVAVAGCGYWGKNLVRNFARLGALELVCDPDPGALRRVADLAEGVEVSADFDAALGDGIDGVVIATPAETHHRLARQALLAGKDVFVEKPLALSYEDAAELIEIATREGRMLMVGHVLEYHPAIRRVVGMVREGRLGKLQYVYSNRLNLGKVRTEENILWSFAPHDVAIILRLVGGMPFQVCACGGGYVQPNIADVTVTNLLFDNGVRAHIYVSWLHPFKEQRLVVIGSRAMVTFDDVHKKLVLHDKRVEMNGGAPTPVRGEGVEIPFGDEEPLANECRAFLEAISTRTAPLTDGKSGLATLQVLQAAQRSLVTNGDPVMLHRMPT